MTRTLTDLTWPRRTARLTLRPATADDAAPVFAYRRLPEVSAWMTRLPDDEDRFVAFFVENLGLTLAIERDGELVGDAMVRIQDAWAQAEVADRAVGTQAELGWCLRPDTWGQGLATEVVHELLAIAFDGLGVRRIEANCFADNVGSWRVMDKVGLRREGYFVAESLHRDGTWRDGISYALLADEWRG